MDFFVIDLKAIQYIIENAFTTALNQFNYRGTLEYFTKVQILYLKSGAWFERKESTPFKIIFLDDEKPYWRHQELEKQDVMYKKGRKRNFLKLENLSTITTEFAEHSLKSHKILSFFDIEKNHGYEADDLASAICKLYPDNKKYFLTVDTDWLPLVSQNNVWLNLRTSYEQSRVITNENAHSFLCNRHKKSSKAQKAFIDSMENVTDYWHFKALFGDTSDGIPPDAQKKYLPYIDLFNPPSAFKLWENNVATSFIKENIESINPGTAMSFDVFKQKAKHPVCFESIKIS